MSVRAYRVIDIKKEHTPTFNLWHDEAIIKHLQDGGWYDDSGLDEGGGLLYIMLEGLKSLIVNATELGITDEDIETIKHDAIEVEKEGLGDEDYVQYYCY